jgi:hypothetical protein
MGGFEARFMGMGGLMGVSICGERTGGGRVAEGVGGPFIRIVGGGDIDDVAMMAVIFVFKSTWSD